MEKLKVRRNNHKHEPAVTVALSIIVEFKVNLNLKVRELFLKSHHNRIGNSSLTVNREQKVPETKN